MERKQLAIRARLTQLAAALLAALLLTLACSGDETPGQEIPVSVSSSGGDFIPTTLQELQTQLPFVIVFPQGLPEPLATVVGQLSPDAERFSRVDLNYEAGDVLFIVSQRPGLGGQIEQPDTIVDGIPVFVRESPEPERLVNALWYGCGVLFELRKFGGLQEDKLDQIVRSVADCATVPS